MSLPGPPVKRSACVSEAIVVEIVNNIPAKVLKTKRAFAGDWIAVIFGREMMFNLPISTQRGTHPRHLLVKEEGNFKYQHASVI